MLHPFGFHMIQHNYNFLDGLLYTLARPLVPLLAFHNAMTWLSVCLNSLAAYCLILRVTSVASLAFIGAVAFAHSPVLTSYYGAQSLTEPYMLVFFVLTSLALFERPSCRRAIGAGILLGLSAYTYPYYFVAGLVWLGIILGHWVFPWTTGETGDARPVRLLSGMIGTWSLSALVLVVVLMPRQAWPFAIDRTLLGIYVLGLLVVTFALVRFAATAWSGTKRRREGRGSNGGRLPGTRWPRPCPYRQFFWSPLRWSLFRTRTRMWRIELSVPPSKAGRSSSYCSASI